MRNPFVRVVGTVEDLFGRQLAIGADHDGVTVGDYTFSAEQREEMDRLLYEADRQAADHARQMEEDAGDD